MSGITQLRLADVPIAVVDVETTGLHPNGDRIIEIAIIKVDPGAEPRVVVDTLVNPQRPVSATEIHGITDADVHDAPTFSEIAPDVATALAGCVFASFNVYFDSKFVVTEFRRAAFPAFPPHLCLMYLRPALGMGKRCTLADACAAHGIEHSHAHFAADDALASAKLWQLYLQKMTEMQIDTYGDLARRLPYKFVQSFDDQLLEVVSLEARQVKGKSRRQTSTHVPKAASRESINPIAEYWEALKACLADLTVTPTEIEYLSGKRQMLGLTDAQIRWLHARAFSGLLAQVSDDHAIDDSEVAKIAALAGGLRTLGWSPGDALTGGSSQRSGLLARVFG